MKLSWTAGEDMVVLLFLVLNFVGCGSKGCEARLGKKSLVVETLDSWQCVILVSLGMLKSSVSCIVARTKQRCLMKILQQYVGS